MEIAAKVKFSLYLSVLCDDSRYGCCPDGITAASGQNYAGCADEDPCKVWKLPRAFLKLYCFLIMPNYSALTALDLITGTVKLLESPEFAANTYLQTHLRISRHGEKLISMYNII